MGLVENIRLLCKETGTSIPKLENYFGWGHGAIYKWDTNKPSIDKLQKVADYFGVSLIRLTSAAPSDEMEELLETLHKRPEMKALFSLTKNASKEDVEKAMKIIEALKDK